MGSIIEKGTKPTREDLDRLYFKLHKKLFFQVSQAGYSHHGKGGIIVPLENTRLILRDTHADGYTSKFDIVEGEYRFIPRMGLSGLGSIEINSAINAYDPHTEFVGITAQRAHQESVYRAYIISVETSMQ